MKLTQRTFWILSIGLLALSVFAAAELPNEEEVEGSGPDHDDGKSTPFDKPTDSDDEDLTDNEEGSGTTPEIITQTTSTASVSSTNPTTTTAEATTTVVARTPKGKPKGDAPTSPAMKEQPVTTVIKSATDEAKDDQKGSPITTGVIIGIIVALIVLILIALVIFLVMKRRRNSRKRNAGYRPGQHVQSRQV